MIFFMKARRGKLQRRLLAAFDRRADYLPGIPGDHLVVGR
jgi:hypothetical protein